MKSRSLRTTALAVFLAASCTGAPADTDSVDVMSAEPLHSAVESLTSIIVYDIFSPPQASRVYAYASIAGYEAVRHGSEAYATLAEKLNGLTAVPQPEPNAEYSFPLAGVHAFMTVGHALTFSRERADSLRTALDNRFRGRMPAAVYERSVAYGDTVAKHILAWAGTDHFKETRGYPKYTVTQTAGRWIPTPPAYMDALEPHWATLRPFTLDSAGQYRPQPPLAFDTTSSSAFMREVNEVYTVSAKLTDDQRDLVRFWDDNPMVMNVQGHTMFATKKATPGGHWMSIAMTASRKANADIVKSAMAYTRTAIALADGFISCWEEKFRSNVIRPETMITRYVDERWEPALQTPPFPEYTSGHSVISNAAAVVLTDLFGENFAFTDSSEVPYGLSVRSFPSFEEAAAEAALSRLYGGIHYRRAVEEGSIQGRRVGEHVVRRTGGTTALTQTSTR